MTATWIEQECSHAMDPHPVERFEQSIRWN